MFVRRCIWLLCLALACAADRSLEAADPNADLVEVWKCRFENLSEDVAEHWDVNYDSWPDRWTRVYDDKHPQYVRMEIDPAEDRAVRGRKLVIHPDGGSATATSPPIRIKPKFSYKLRVRAKLSGAEHGKARVRMAFHHKHEEQPRQQEQTVPIESDGEWHSLELGDFKPHDNDVDRLYVHIDYERGDRGDLTAELAVADIRLYRLPSIRIYTDNRYNVYTDIKDVKVTCSLSGILKQNPEIRFQLLDATDKSIGAKGELELNGTIISESRTFAADIVDGFGSDKPSYEGEIGWQPPIRENGFYRVRVGMFNPDTGQPIGESRAITLAVVGEGLETSKYGEFGWSLPAADRPLSFDTLQELLPRVGVKMVKLPVWFQPDDHKRGDQLLRFSEQLSARGIETIGILEDPTPRLADRFTEIAPPEIQSFLSTDPSYWTPRIDHVITRLSLRIRWWQLGHDGDTSFVGFDDLIEKISAIRNQMFRFGQDIKMGVGWRWDYLREWSEPRSWDFEQMSGREQLDAAGLDSALESAPPSTAHRWVLVAPPEVDRSVPEGANPNDPNDPVMRQALVSRHQHRVRDFVKQILVAKIHDADGIFVADPFSGLADVTLGRTGVMNQDGTPGELLLPWRTCARLLGRAKYIGSLQLPANSSNWLFKRPDGQIVMVLWNLQSEAHEVNAAPIEERLYLGESVYSVDIWGDSKELELQDGRQVVSVGRMPRFVVGLNEAVARWRMATRFESEIVPSIFLTPHDNALLAENTFGQGVGGLVSVFVPEAKTPHKQGAASPSRDKASPDWQVLIEDRRFSLPTAASLQAAIGVTLKDATHGDQAVRIDFDLTTDRDYRFSVWRNLHVGTGDVELDVQTYVGEDGRLVIEQLLRKTVGPPSDFRCLLYAKNRRRKRTQVYQLGPDLVKKRFTYLNADDLIGQEMRLRVEEIDGRRVLIHRFMVDPKPISEANDEKAESLARAGAS